MCWTSPDCLSGCKHRTAKNADGKQARAQSKPGSGAGRNNVTVRGRYAVKMSGLHPMFDRSYIRECKPIEPLHILKKDGYRLKIQFEFIANDLIFSLIRDMIRNMAKGGRSYGGKLQKTVPSYD